VIPTTLMHQTNKDGIYHACKDIGGWRWRTAPAEPLGATPCMGVESN
jgi:hypothetical protein